MLVRTKAHFIECSIHCNILIILKPLGYLELNFITPKSKYKGNIDRGSKI